MPFKGKWPLILLFLLFGLSANGWAEEFQEDMARLKETHAKNLKDLPKPIRESVLRSSPNQWLINVCTGNITGQGNPEYALAMFDLKTSTLAFHVYGIKERKAVATRDIVLAKSDFEIPILMITHYSAVSCWKPEDAKRSGEEAHAGYVATDGKLDTVCWATNDAEADCFRYDSAANKFIEAEGWAN